MTEAEWLRSEDHRAMMYFLRDTASPRKLQLFACACCRRVKWYDTSVIGLLEKYADGQCKRKDAMSAVRTAIPEGRIDAYCKYLFWRAHCHYGADSVSAFCVNDALNSKEMVGSPDNYRVEARHHAALIRCIFGNPFRSAALDRAWLTRATVSLAQTAYGERALPSGELEPARLAVLADALEEAGCTATDVLEHLRSSVPHVRGCWAVDVCLSRP